MKTELFEKENQQSAIIEEFDFLDRDELGDLQPEDFASINRIGKPSGLQFFSKNYVSEYEAIHATYTIKTWEELSSKFDLSWAKEKDYRVVESMDELRELYKEFSKASIIAIDTETTGTNIFNLKWSNSFKDHIVGMSLSWKKDQGIYLPFLHEKFTNLPLVEVLNFLKNFLETATLVAHNAIFDYKVFFDLGIRLNICHDTMQMIYHLDSRTAHGGKALKGAIKKIFGIDTVDLEEMTGASRYAGLFRKVEKAVAKVYACADTDFALYLFDYLHPFLDIRQYSPYVQDIKLIPIIARSEYYGKPIDLEKTRMLNDVNDKDISTLRELLFSYVGTSMNLRRGINEPAQYIFNLNSSAELCEVMYEILGYEIKAWSSTTGLPSFNSGVIKALIKEKSTSHDVVLDMLVKGDIKTAFADINPDLSNDDKILLKESDLRNTKHPAVVILKKLRGLIKLKTAFFNKLLSNTTEGYWYTSISLTGTETARLVDVAQTLASYMRLLVAPHDPENWALADADYAQIEARVMAGFGNSLGTMKNAEGKSVGLMQDLVDNLNHPESDYHRVAGAPMYNTTPEDMTDEQRHDVKAANFGIPFAMKAKGLTNFMYGLVSDEEREKRLIAATQKLLDNWEVHNKPIKDYLDGFRNSALTVCKEPKVLKYFKGMPVAKIYNDKGRSRVFSLDGVVSENGDILDKNKASSIYRQSGNFPIQSFARDIYGNGILGIWHELEANGMTDVRVADPDSPMGYRFEQLVYIVCYVHDEVLLMWHKSINVRFIIKVISRHFKQHIDGFPNFYTGINIATNWYEGKESKYECPVVFAEEMIRDEFPLFWRTPIEPRDYVYEELRQYMARRILKELMRIMPELRIKGVFRCDVMYSEFKNYFLKPWIKRFEDRVHGDFITDFIRRDVAFRKDNPSDVDFECASWNKIISRAISLATEMLGTVYVDKGVGQLLVFKSQTLLGIANVVEAPLSVEELDRVAILSDDIIERIMAVSKKSGMTGMGNKVQSVNVSMDEGVANELITLVDNKETMNYEFETSDLLDDEYDYLWDGVEEM